eukprot:CAMPEP_0169297514 /NCGR_PEP_ID=MMETSP1016-20121227/65786_1 /TAXON_ID=342587 /ORGANISM="Karlodinium micrum, Strain CCMP2283" /LENGTH=58 /DNA_ID=CAMNT_0009389121 /DNA_START=655 /DNA_END=828 /DNA_ORIENTATION=+
MKYPCPLSGSGGKIFNKFEIATRSSDSNGSMKKVTKQRQLRTWAACETVAWKRSRSRD